MPGRRQVRCAPQALEAGPKISTRTKAPSGDSPRRRRSVRPGPRCGSRFAGGHASPAPPGVLGRIVFLYHHEVSRTRAVEASAAHGDLPIRLCGRMMIPASALESRSRETPVRSAAVRMNCRRVNIGVIPSCPPVLPVESCYPYRVSSSRPFGSVCRALRCPGRSLQEPLDPLNPRHGPSSPASSSTAPRHACPGRRAGSDSNP